MNHKYILDGHKAVLCDDDLMKWAKWLETTDRKVARTDIPVPQWKYLLGKIFKIKKYEPIRISTVFLGLNHCFREGTPLLFETMVFGGKLDEEMERYSTWEEAEEGHKRWVAKAKAEGE